jgi:hypothetical protein
MGLPTRPLRPRRAATLALATLLGLTGSAVAAPDAGVAAAPAAPTVAPGPARDFIAEARLFYRVVACAGDAPVPASLDAAVIDAHCKDLATRIARYQSRYVQPASEFFAAVRPAGLPTTVVYPFGGGDLASALITYPDAREITTMSLEHPGDPTRLATLDKRTLKNNLALFRATIGGLLANNDSASVNMMKMEKGPIPGQLAFFITALAILGYEPVSLHFVRLDDTGAVVPLSEADIAAMGQKKAKKKKGTWVDTDYSEAFTHMELAFRRRGDAAAPLVVHRHFAANLANDAFIGSPLEKHLRAKGRIVALTKAASYLLWLTGFSGIRDYLLTSMDFMASDSTGIPPRFARKAGFKQTTYGTFTGSYLGTGEKENEAFRALWSSQPRRKLRFRYGYPDTAGNVHLMITAPAAKAAP